MFPTCGAGGLEVSAELCNGSRIGDALGAEVRAQGVDVELSVYRDGQAILHEPGFCKIAYGDSFTLDATSVPPLAHQADQDLLVLARCSLPGGEGHFAQEHQLTYSRGKRSSHLLYDQLPVPRPGKAASPIVLLAPKAWCSVDVNTYISFASSGRGGRQSMVITILDRAGEILHQQTRETPTTGNDLLDVRACLPASYAESKSPRFVNVVARGGEAAFAILTFVVNQRTDSVALEHSLSPHYYVRAIRDPLRRNALQFSEAP